MITGDHVTTAGAIADQLGIEGTALSGTEFAALSDAELDAQVEDIGVVARVAPEDKVRLVEALKEKGHVVAMTGDGVNDAPALKRADIGVAMGITGTEVTKEAGDMILTDDNFATVVAAVEGGRAIYDNLMKYVRFQMITLGGFILLFLGAGIFDVANGIPLTPLQILWVNFAIDVLLAIGLGFDAAAPGLMRRRPRNANAPVIDRPLGIRLGLAALVMAVLALVVVAWGEHRYALEVATTMGMTTLGLMHIVAALEAREPEETIFKRYTIENRRFVQLRRRGARALAPRHDALASAANLRYRGADRRSVGDLPARPDRLSGAHRARASGSTGAPARFTLRRQRSRRRPYAGLSLQIPAFGRNIWLVKRVAASFVRMALWKRAVLSSLLVLCAAIALAPSAGPSKRIPNGVRIAGVNVSGLDAGQAKQQIGARFATPLRFKFAREHWAVSPERLGMNAAIGDAVSRALDARQRRRHRRPRRRRPETP